MRSLNTYKCIFEMFQQTVWERVARFWETSCFLVCPTPKPCIHPVSQVWPALFAKSHLTSPFVFGSSPSQPEWSSQNKDGVSVEEDRECSPGVWGLVITSILLSAFDPLTPDLLFLGHCLPCPSWERATPAEQDCSPGTMSEHSCGAWAYLFAYASLCFWDIGSWNL